MGHLGIWMSKILHGGHFLSMLFPNFSFILKEEAQGYFKTYKYKYKGIRINEAGRERRLRKDILTQDTFWLLVTRF